MSPSYLFAATGLAMLAAWLIHRLHRGARRSLVVASMKPFDNVSRPRLTFARVRQPLLLVCRLALLAGALAAILIERPVTTERAFDGDVIAVVPGAPAAAWRVFDGASAEIVWLDAALSDALPVATDASRNVAAALLRLDQLMRADAALTVVGDLPAADWPVRMPLLSREVQWIAADTERQPDRIAWPAAIWIVGGEGALREQVRDGVELWRRAGALADDIAVRALRRDAFAWPDTAVAVLWLDAAPPAPQRPDQAIVQVARDLLPAGSGQSVEVEDGVTTGVLATRLWHALMRLPAQRPVAMADVAPLPAAAPASIGLDGSVLQPRAVATLAPWLVWLLVGLFVTERGLSLSGGKR